jgi:hypothetical protein
MKIFVMANNGRRVHDFMRRYNLNPKLGSDVEYLHSPQQLRGTQQSLILRLYGWYAHPLSQTILDMTTERDCLVCDVDF